MIGTPLTVIPIDGSPHCQQFRVLSRSNEQFTVLGIGTPMTFIPIDGSPHCPKMYLDNLIILPKGGKEK